MVKAARESLVIGQVWGLHKRPFMWRKLGSAITRVGALHKAVALLKGVGDTFLQC